jgi:hypothetical protein
MGSYQREVPVNPVCPTELRLIRVPALLAPFEGIIKPSAKSPMAGLIDLFVNSFAVLCEQSRLPRDFLLPFLIISQTVRHLEAYQIAPHEY